MEHFLPLLKRRPGREIVICPSFPLLPVVLESIKKGKKKGSQVRLGAQNAHAEFLGAFTGEVSVDQLKDAGCEYVILGHSERRAQAGETDEIINKKAISALRVGLTPILCVGESAMERKTGRTLAVLKKQVRGIMANISQKNKNQIIFAYEPVWAIGSGKTPVLEDIEDAHDTIRQASGVSHILYGGSVNPRSIQDLLPSPEINGFLIGSASLDPIKLAELVNLA